MTTTTTSGEDTQPLEALETPGQKLQAEAESSVEFLGISLEIDRNINFAMQQNDVRVVKSLEVSNRSVAALRDVELRIECEPEFSLAFSRTLSVIPGNENLILRDIDLQLSPLFLLNLHERIRGLLKIELWVGDQRLLQRAESVELLAYNEWSGLQSLPEILAAFVMPNHPEVGNVLGSAGRLLSSRTAGGGLSGYQSGEPARILEMTHAIYDALQALEFNYASPPASFEERGQRVRTPDQIIEEKLATCLDSVVFFAACLEQAGLHPLIIMLRDHAFCGVWMQEEIFSYVMTYDLPALRNRIPLGEIVVFESTCLTAKKRVNFEQARREGERHLQNEDNFICVLDIRRARNAKIRPLPLRGTKEYAHLPAGPEAIREATVVLRQFQPHEALPGEEDDNAPAARLEHWRRKLLDLSLRNNLLNFGRTRKSLPVLTHSLCDFEDVLADGVKFRVEPRPKEFGEADPRDTEAYQERTGKDGVADFLAAELTARRIHVDLTEIDLEPRLFKMHNEARLAIEEGGASGLYAAIGFLKWYEAAASERPRLAPLLLIPVEIERKSLANGFRITRGADDARVNTTLLEMLKQDFGLILLGLDPLPQDDNGIDVNYVLNSFRKAVLDVPRWDVVERIEVGFFSFAKFIMWRDLQDRVDALLKNPLVDHIVNRPNQIFEPGAAFPDLDTLDEEFAPSDCYCPVDSDSSQLRAVLAAANGRSFVLEGPPGTGKSQTITNIISHCLASGKTVLFVSEKMAALNVVFDRLSKIGLGRFCLELHSNKSRKHEVIQQLGESLNGAFLRRPEDWEREAAQVAHTRQLLNGYVDALHRIRCNGSTVFHATSQLIKLRGVPAVKLHWDNPHQHDREAMEQLRDAVDALAGIGAACGNLSAHPWRGVERQDWSMAWRDQTAASIGALHAAAIRLAQRLAATATHLGVPPDNLTLNQVKGLAQAALLMADAPALPGKLLLTEDWERSRAGIQTWIEQGQRRDHLRKTLFSVFKKSLLDTDPSPRLARWTVAQHTHPLIGWYKRWGVRREIKHYLLAAKHLPFAAIGDALEKAVDLRKLEEKFGAAQDHATLLLGNYWNLGEPDWEEVGNIERWVSQWRGCASLLGGNLENILTLRQHWARLLAEAPDLLRRTGEAGRGFAALNEALPRFLAAKDAVVEILQLNQRLAWGDDDVPGYLSRVDAQLEAWNQSHSRLQEWCNWREKRAVALSLGLGPLVKGYEQGAIESGSLMDIFHHSYFAWWLAAVSDSEDVLRKFVSVNHERDIRKFRQADVRHMELTKQLIAARLAQQIPQPAAETSAKSEVGLLQRELAKKRKHTSIRQLLGKIPHLLPRLKPCMLMSPMSVAQYLDPNHAPFDLIIFDEASQIAPWDAIGAIARGKQAIIVGDPKQLPPTTFFMKAGNDSPTEEGMVEDLESILDDCMVSLRTLTLDWHYRSRHESLIHFSNVHYYENRLLTFPSPHPEGMGVQWRHVAGGVYDRGKSATNRGEADQIVAEIVQRLTHPQRRDWSIGIVTFNAAQQLLIESLLEEARREHPAIDPYFSDEAAERLFVKNLENVQGDERDVIIFSICYGPDAQGRVWMNFGPINNDGGERRLNVAVTRARRELVVFSSLRADQIDLARTRAKGALHLKTFLDYAQRGPQAIEEVSTLRPEADFDSPFERQVFDALIRKGWTVHFQVGCSGYRIDLAVVHPESPGQYLLGIECDGANYHRAKTARDRDRLRETVLRGLGWEIVRVWSTDWWNDPNRETERLCKACEETLAQLRTLPQTRAAQPVVPERQALLKNGFLTEEAQANAVQEERAQYLAQSMPGLPVYQVSSLPKRGTPAAFYTPKATPVLVKDIESLVEAEGPVNLHAACKRVAGAWEVKRVTERVQERMRGVLAK